ncbi:MAG: hypothetical protein P8J32_05080 [bacterium]|nr:hypothetical protein [bacterium]
MPSGGSLDPDGLQQDRVEDPCLAGEEDQDQPRHQVGRAEGAVRSEHQNERWNPEKPCAPLDAGHRCSIEGTARIQQELTHGVGVLEGLTPKPPTTKHMQEAKSVEQDGARLKSPEDELSMLLVRMSRPQRNRLEQNKEQVRQIIPLSVRE